MIRILSLPVLCTILLSLLSLQSESILMYAQKSWYIAAKVNEETHVGTLVKNKEVLGPSNRQSTYSLCAKEGTYKLYDPDKLIPSKYLNTKIRIKGKLIEDKLSKISNEIWLGVMESTELKK